MIHVKGNYYIDADAYCYQLKKFTGYDKEGKPNYNNLVYCGTVAGCLQKLMQMEQREAVNNSDLTVSEALDKFKEINKEMERLLYETESKEKLGGLKHVVSEEA